MASTDLIAASLRDSHGFAMGLLRDMADAPTVRSHSDAGPHCYWLAGHLVVSEAAVLDQYLDGKAHRYQNWIQSFGIGSVPAQPAPIGPAYGVLLDELDTV
ncbi:MAG: hypothetical protein NCW75_01065 [Phycisphaera sp.]|nr:MAG: hypothetical protein NCW75_01065 [Phycisphaera sp.]